MASPSVVLRWSALLLVASWALAGESLDMPKAAGPGNVQRRGAPPRRPQRSEGDLPKGPSRRQPSAQAAGDRRMPPHTNTPQRPGPSGPPQRGRRSLGTEGDSPNGGPGQPGSTGRMNAFGSTFPAGIDPSLHNFGLPHRVTDLVTMEIRMDPPPTLGAAPPEQPASGSAPRISRRGFTGNVTIALFGDAVPKTVENFKLLCKGGAAIETGARHEGYAASTFHRVLRDFIIQGGDFEFNDGFGGYAVLPQDQLVEGSEATPGGKRRYLADENFVIRHRQGSVAMAAHEANTNGAQFYILLDSASASELDGRHVVFGQVLQGFTTTVQTITRAKTDDAQRPLAPITIVACDVFPFVAPTEPHHAGARIPDPNKLEPGAEVDAEEVATPIEQGPRRLHDPPRRSKRGVLSARAKWLEQEEARRKSFSERQRRGPGGGPSDAAKPHPRRPNGAPSEPAAAGKREKDSKRNEPGVSTSESQSL